MESLQNRQNASDSELKASADRARKNRLAIRAAFSLSTLFAVAIVLMTNYLSFRHYQRFDLTREGLFTLSDKSKAVLRKLSTDVDIYLFMSRSEPNFVETNELLKRYQTSSRRIHLHAVDPDREPAEFQVLVQRFGLGAALLDNFEVGVDVAAVVTAGDKKWSVKRDDLLEWDMNAEDERASRKVNVKAEQAITGAVVEVTSGRATKLCLAKGHGEWTIEAGDERTLESLKEALKHDNLEWEAIETLGKKRIPKGCDAVFVVGPTRAFAKDEAELLAHYLREGGNLLLALDPVIERDEIQKTGLEEMARGFGIAIDSNLVIELNRDHLVSTNPIEFLVTQFGDHTTTRVLQNRARVFLALARSIRPLEASEAEILLRSTAEAFGEKEISRVQNQAEQPKRDESDIKGPVSLAVAKSVLADPEASPADDKPRGRLVVIGDSDWLRGELLNSPELANYHLASAWTGWLTEREALIAIPAKKAKSGSVIFTQADLSGLFFKLIVLLPGVVFVFGFAVWLNRRS
ncbi:MAG: GldG family protein [Deltaproteobacteria bacterium]|nr:GldG family protein [Deltaproteobacteria bacterium]